MSTARTYWSDTITHEATGVTYHFAEEVEYGHYWNGDIFVVSNGGDVVITKITPEDTLGDGRVTHGAMLQPDGTTTNGFDDAVTWNGRLYEASENVDPAATGAPLTISHAEHPGGASLVKAVSLEDLSTQRDRSVIDKFSVLTITPETPPKNAFRPPVAGDDKTSAYTLADLDFSKLQSVAPVSGQQPISDFDNLIEATFVSWWSSPSGEELRYFHPDSYHDGYGDYQLDDLIGAFMALHSNYEQAEKESLYAAIVQQGLDYAGGVNEGVRWPANGGHNNFYKPFVVTAASALNSQELRDLAIAEGVYSEDGQFRYVAPEYIGVEFFESTTNQDPKLGSEYQDVQLGMPEWVLRDDSRFDPDLTASYRMPNSDNVPILALTMEMLGDGEGREIWSNEAYFDYAERMRLMHEVDVTPAGTFSGHGAEADWMAFLDAYHRLFSAGGTMDFRPEAPLEVTASAADGGLDIAIGGDVLPGSAPVERVDIRYRSVSDGETWTVVEDFGMSGRLEGLAGGDVYFVQARYVSAIGEGAWSDNGFEATNGELIDRLKSEGFITDAYMDTFRGQRQYQKTEDYKDHLRSILAGEDGYEEMADDMLSATAILPQPDTTPQPHPEQEPEPIIDPAPEPEPAPEDEARAMGVVQRVAGLDHEARTVDFRDGLELTDAIVFVTPPTFEGAQAASVALEEVTATGAAMAIREPDYLDGRHAGEDLAMLALEAGSWTLADGSRLEVGSLTLEAGRTESFASVTFDEAFDEAPAILVQLQTSNGADWAVLRTRDVTTTGFDVALQEQEASDGLHETEIVGWAALDAAAADGVVDWFGMTAQAFTADRLADHTGGAMAYDAALGPDALIAAGISSFYGSDAATLRLTETRAEGEQTIAAFLVQEEQSRDSEIRHFHEDISGIAFAQEGALSALPTPADLALVDAMSAYMDLG